MPAKKKKPKDKPHYVNNREFSHAIDDYVMELNEARKKGTEEPRVTEYIGECFMKICYGLASKPNFSQYTYKEEMVMDAVENLLNAVSNYNINTKTRTGSPNAFGYFTMIAYRAFLRRIAKEKRQTEIKERIMEQYDYSDIAEGNCDGGEGIVQRIRSRNDNLRRRREDGRDFKVVKRTRRKKSDSLTNLDEFFG